MQTRRNETGARQPKSVVVLLQWILALSTTPFFQGLACEYAFDRLNPPRNATGVNLVHRTDIVVQIPIDIQRLPDQLEPYRSHEMMSSGIYVELIRSFESMYAQIIEQNSAGSILLTQPDSLRSLPSLVRVPVMDSKGDVEKSIVASDMQHTKTYYDFRRTDGSIGFLQSLLLNYGDKNLCDSSIFLSTNQFLDSNCRVHSLPEITRLSTPAGDSVFSNTPAIVKDRWRSMEKLENGKFPSLALLDFLNSNVENRFDGSEDGAGRQLFDLTEQDQNEMFLKSMRSKLNSYEMIHSWSHLENRRLGGNVMIFLGDGEWVQIGVFNVDSYTMSGLTHIDKLYKSPKSGLMIDVELWAEVIERYVPKDKLIEGINNFNDRVIGLLNQVEKPASHFLSKISRLSRMP